VNKAFNGTIISDGIVDGEIIIIIWEWIVDEEKEREWRDG